MSSARAPSSGIGTGTVPAPADVDLSEFDVPDKRKVLGQIADLLERNGIDVEDIGKVHRVNVWQAVSCTHGSPSPGGSILGEGRPPSGRMLALDGLPEPGRLRPVLRREGSSRPGSSDGVGVDPGSHPGGCSARPPVPCSRLCQSSAPGDRHLARKHHAGHQSRCSQGHPDPLSSGSSAVRREPLYPPATWHQALSGVSS